MIKNLNLASDPFRNRTLPWTVAAIVACVSVLALIFTVSSFRQTRDRATSVERDVAACAPKKSSLRRRLTP